MVNTVILVGKVIYDIKKIKINNIQYGNLFLDVKVKDENHTIKCLLSETLLNDAIEFIGEGQIVGIKGYMTTIGNKQEIIIEKITTTTKKEEA